MSHPKRRNTLIEWLTPLYRPLLTQTDYAMARYWLSQSHYNSKHSTMFTVVVLHLHYKVHSG